MDTANVVTAAIAGVSALVALAALYFTHQQVKLAERQTELQEKVREDQAQPYVWADVRPSDKDGHLMLLVIKNEGPTVAQSVSVSFDPPLPTHWGGEREDAERTTYRLTSMPPGRAVRWYVGTGPAWAEADDERLFTVKIAYRGPYGDAPTLEYDLSFKDFHDSAVQPPGTLHGVTGALKDLTKEVRASRRQ